MKNIIIILIIFIFSFVGLSVKNRFIKQKKVLLELKQYLEFYKNNLSIFKNNMHKILNDYLDKDDSKKIFFNEIFIQNDKFVKVDEDKFLNYFYQKEQGKFILNYFSNYGMLDADLEKKNCEYILKVLDENIKLTEKDINEKGNLYFKIFLAIGVVVAIIVW